MGAVRIDTPAEVMAWKLLMARVAHAQHVAVPEGFKPGVATMGAQSRELMNLLAQHAHVTANGTLNSTLQSWLVAHDPTPLSRPVADAHIYGGQHPTLGLPGFPAYDFGGPAGRVVCACEAGVVDEWSGHDPAQGPVSGIHGPFGWSLYLAGRSGARYYYTHLGERLAGVGAGVVAGQVVGRIGDYARFGGVDHCHLGVREAPDGHPNVFDVFHAPDPALVLGEL